MGFLTFFYKRSILDPDSTENPQKQDLRKMASLNAATAQAYPWHDPKLDELKTATVEVLENQRIEGRNKLQNFILAWPWLEIPRDEIDDPILADLVESTTTEGKKLFFDAMFSDLEVIANTKPEPWRAPIIDQAGRTLLVYGPDDTGPDDDVSRLAQEIMQRVPEVQGHIAHMIAHQVISRAKTWHAAVDQQNALAQRVQEIAICAMTKNDWTTWSELSKSFHATYNGYFRGVGNDVLFYREGMGPVLQEKCARWVAPCSNVAKLLRDALHESPQK